MKKNKDSMKKEMKRGSYEIEKETNGTVHLSQAPKPHSFGSQITEDME